MTPRGNSKLPLEKDDNGSHIPTVDSMRLNDSMRVGPGEGPHPPPLACTKSGNVSFPYIPCLDEAFATELAAAAAGEPSRMRRLRVQL